MPPGPSNGRLSPCQYLRVGGAESVAADRWGYFPVGSEATGSPGKVDHDVSMALMHLGEGEWCHLAPHLEGLCHCLPHLLPYQLPREPEDPGGRRRGLGLAWDSPCWLMGQELPLDAQWGCMHVGHKPGVLWASAAVPLPQGNIFVWVCMSFGAHRCLHLMERMQNQEPQDPPSRPDCATHCGETLAP